MISITRWVLFGLLISACAPVQKTKVSLQLSSPSHFRALQSGTGAQASLSAESCYAIMISGDRINTPDPISLSRNQKSSCLNHPQKSGDVYGLFKLGDSLNLELPIGDNYRFDLVEFKKNNAAAGISGPDACQGKISLKAITGSLSTSPKIGVLVDGSTMSWQPLLKASAQENLVAGENIINLILNEDQGIGANLECAEVPLLSYGTAPALNGLPGALLSISPTLLNNNGAPITGCSTTPTLPAGVTIDSSTCVISGAFPAAETSTYQVKASNLAGDSEAVSIAVQIASGVPEIHFTTISQSAIVGNSFALSPTSLSSNGSAISSCTVIPTLPSGLSLNPNTCVVSGSVSLASITLVTYSVTATNSFGNSNVATFSLNSIAGLPSISYASSTGTTGTAGSPMTVNPSTYNSNGSTITSCTTSPTLPTGLTINSACVISGTPTVYANSSSYTVTATNGVGPSQVTVTLEVLGIAPSLSYAGASGTTSAFTTGFNVSPSTLNGYGASITNCSSSDKPAWLSVSSSNCQVSGTPSSGVGAGSFTFNVSAFTAMGNSYLASLTLVVNADAPSLSYTSAPGTSGQLGTAMNVSPTLIEEHGASITSCSATPTLPAGLSISSICVISGTPTVIQTATTYTITATNSAGNGSTTVSLTVDPGLPQLSYAHSHGMFGAQLAAMNITPSLLSASGGTITSCSTSPTLPSGLSIDPNTCVISGTPTSSSALTNYTISASNSTGSTSAILALSVATTGTAADLKYSEPAGYNFGSVSVGQTPTHVVYVQNGGGVNATAMSPNIPSPFSIAGGGTCVASLAPGDECTLVIQFTPTLSTASSAGLSFNFNDGSTSQNHGLTVAGIGTGGPTPASLNLSQTYDFTQMDISLGQTATHTFTITNSGGVSATAISASITAPFSYVGGSYPGTSGTCSATLASGASCTLNVLYAPAFNGSYNSSIWFNYNDGSSTQAGGINLLGTAINGPTPATLTATPGSFNFGTVTTFTFVDQAFTISNTGGVSATGFGAVLSPPYSQYSSNCGTTIASGGTCTVTVRFTPTVTGSSPGSLHLNFNNGITSAASDFSITGTGQ